MAPNSCDVTLLDSHTVPIIFGAIGVLLACTSWIFKLAFSLLQLHALSQRNRDEIEDGTLKTCEHIFVRAVSSPKTVTIVVAAAANRELHLGHVIDNFSVPQLILPYVECVSALSRHLD